MKKPLVYLSLCLSILAGIFIFTLNKVSAAGTISGTVYVDHNMNGVRNTSGAAPNLAVDSGVASVTVTVFAGNGASKSAVTAANGSYTIDTSASPALPAGPYRVEFTNLPTGFFPSIVGTNNGTTVRVVPDGNSTGIDLGIINNQAYCQNNPDLYLPISNFGPQVSPDISALVRFPYSAGTLFTSTDAGATNQQNSSYSSPLMTDVLPSSEIGTTWGTAYQRTTGRLFLASHFKRHFGFANNNPAAIYVTNPTNGSVITTFNVPAVTLNSHLAGGGTYETDGGNAGWAAVGKQSLGGLDISDDEQSLFVMNLENRTLYRLDAQTGLSTGSVATSGLTLPTPGGSQTNCLDENKRPFAVKYHQGVLYLGMVCSGETGTQNVTNLRAYVFTVNPVTLVINTSPVVNIPLNYSRGSVSTFGTARPAAWRVWSATYQQQPTSSTATQEVSWPQPILKGITFQDGNMIIGIGDRFGDQVGYLTPSNPSTTALRVANSAGDTLKLCGSPTLGWTLESNARCGLQGNGPQNNGQGPGNGEFFYQDFFNDNVIYTGSHQEVTTGGLDVIPGVPQVVSTVYDPVNQQTVGPTVNWAFTQGLRFLNTTTGQTDRAYFVNRVDLSKGNDLGQVITACNPAPLQIGNLVWLDSNNNGVQDPQEAGIAGVTVQLFAGSVLVGTAVTDANGNYIFGGPNNTNLNPGISILPNTAYTIVLPASNFASGQPLNNRLPTTPNNGGSSNGISRDSNGVRVDNTVVATLTTGTYGQNNHTYDFGFVVQPTSAQVEVAGRAVDANGRGINNAVVILTSKSGETHLRAVTSTFGYFRFTGIEAGQTYSVIASHSMHNFTEPVRIISTNGKISDIVFMAASPQFMRSSADSKSTSLERKR